MSTILIIVLILLLIGALPTWPHSANWGYFPSGGLGLVLLILHPGPDRSARSAHIGEGPVTVGWQRPGAAPSVARGLVSPFRISDGVRGTTGPERYEHGAIIISYRRTIL